MLVGRTMTNRLNKGRGREEEEGGFQDATKNPTAVMKFTEAESVLSNINTQLNFHSPFFKSHKLLSL